MLVPFLRALEEMGADIDLILTQAEIPSAALRDPEARFASKKIVAFLNAATEISGDEDLGLHAAERSDLKQLDILGYLMLTTPDPLEAFHRLQRYSRLLGDRLDFEMRAEGDHVILVLHWSDTETHRAGVECALGISLMAMRKLLGKGLQPVETHFAHPAPRDTREHKRIFGGVLHFGAAENQLRIRIGPEFVADELSTADAGLSEVLERHAAHLLEQLPEKNDFVARVRRLITDELAGGDPSVENISTRLQMSTRTFRRRLEERGTKHRLLLDELRRALAVRYLDEEALEITEVAFLLGFSQASAFHRAFKRWTGTTPSDYRRRRLASD